MHWHWLHCLLLVNSLIEKVLRRSLFQQQKSVTWREQNRFEDTSRAQVSDYNVAIYDHNNVLNVVVSYDRLINACGEEMLSTYSTCFICHCSGHTHFHLHHQYYTWEEGEIHLIYVFNFFHLINICTMDRTCRKKLFTSLSPKDAIRCFKILYSLRSYRYAYMATLCIFSIITF